MFIISEMPMSALLDQSNSGHKMIIRFLLVSALTCTISACGFHLRGQIDVPDSISVLAIQTDDTDLYRSLVEALDFSGVTVVQSSADAKALLDLHKVEFERKVRTIDDRGKVTGYNLIYRVFFKVTSAKGEKLRQSAVVARRDFNFDPDLVLQKEIEENALREDMVKELTRSILRQLSTIAAAPTINKLVLSFRHHKA